MKNRKKRTFISPRKSLRFSMHFLCRKELIHRNSQSKCVYYWRACFFIFITKIKFLHAIIWMARCTWLPHYRSGGSLPHLQRLFPREWIYEALYLFEVLVSSFCFIYNSTTNFSFLRNFNMILFIITLLNIFWH